MENKIINLEESFPNEINSPAAYDVPIVIGWYLDGYSGIAVLAERRRCFIHFAVVNGLASFNSDGFCYIAGMKVITVTK